MRTHLLLIAVLMLGTTAMSAADARQEDAIDAKAAFARLKSLAGEWQADTSMGKVRTTYEVIAGGTALVEHETGEKMPPMLTVFHLDGKRLILTHYCAAGNQPRMKAVAFDPKSGEVKFEFLDITNMASPTAGHMRNATFYLAEKDRMTSKWEYFEGGQQKSHEAFQYTRVK